MKKRKLLLLGVVCTALYACSTDQTNESGKRVSALDDAAIFDGEEYDARELPGYDTLDKLSTPEKNTEFEGEILPSNGGEVYFREDLALSPQKAYL